MVDCRGRRLGVPFSVFPYTCFGLPRVRVSGGHLCEAEALTEPAGETRQPLQIGYIYKSQRSSDTLRFAFCALHSVRQTQIYLTNEQHIFYLYIFLLYLLCFLTKYDIIPKV